MWNLRYGCKGNAVRLGTKADPGKPQKAKKNRQPKRGRTKALKVVVNPLHIPADQRLRFLSDCNKKGSRISKDILIKRRAEFEKNKYRLLPLLGKNCYACRIAVAAVRHHIIPLFLGGTNIKKNLVPLCNKCHDGLHPWLLQVKPLETTLTDSDHLPAWQSQAAGSACVTIGVLSQ